MERAVILTQSLLMGVKNLPTDFQGEPVLPIPTGDSFEESVNLFKKQLILNALQKSGNNKAEAARQLKISWAYLFRLLNKLELKDVWHTFIVNHTFTEYCNSLSSLPAR